MIIKEKEKKRKERKKGGKKIQALLAFQLLWGQNEQNEAIQTYFVQLAFGKCSCIEICRWEGKIKIKLNKPVIEQKKHYENKLYIIWSYVFISILNYYCKYEKIFLELYK